MKHFIHYFTEDKTVRLDVLITERSPEVEYLDVDRPAVLICPGGVYLSRHRRPRCAGA